MYAAVGLCHSERSEESRPESFVQRAGRESSLRSLESLVFPAKAGIQFVPDMDPRFRGGDVLTFISMGRLLGHEYPE
jgi:hypothetical protein